MDLETLSPMPEPVTLARAATSLAVALCILALLIKEYNEWKRRRTFIKQHGCKPAASSSLRWPFLYGLDHMVENAYNIINHRFALGVHQRFDRFGKTHTSRILHRRIINTIDPCNLETVMKRRSEDYTIIPGRRKLVGVLFGNGVFASEGEDWRHSRALVRAGMLHFVYDSSRFEKHADAMISRIARYNGAAFDFAELAFGYTLDLGTDILLGESAVTSDEGVPFQHGQFRNDFARLGKMARALTIFISQIPYLAEIVYGTELKDVQQRVFHHVDQHVQRSIRSQKGQAEVLRSREQMRLTTTGVVDGLVARTQDTKRIRSELLNLLLAGHDGVGIALSELFYCLARNAKVWSSLRAEIRDTLHGRLPTHLELKSMTYLNWTINEAIRVQPTLSAHAKRAVRDTVLPHGGGIAGNEPLYVQKGTYVVYSNYALHRNPDVFGADIDDFRPERWAQVRPTTFEYLGFGAGPRICPGRFLFGYAVGDEVADQVLGKEMGWTMLAYMTARLAQEIESLSPADDRPWEEATAFSFHNRHGVHISATLDTASGSES